MKILIMNWRDIKNPSGGGAEILTHELAKRWVTAGHHVTQFSASFPKAKSQELIDGVQFYRKGKWWTVHIHGVFFYLRNKSKFDVIIDEVHWFPFFAVLYAPKKTFALTCEVATKLIFRIFPFPVALIFYFIEKVYLYLYQQVPTMVISPSTRDDLIKLGHNKDTILLLPMGLTLPSKLPIVEKEKNPTIVSVGRLNKQKGTLDVIDAFTSIHLSIPSAQLWLVGSGSDEFKAQVKDKIDSAGIANAVRLWGFVSEEEKFRLMSRAHVLVSASAQEGWGLTIPESGAVKTPSVVYNIPGFRDIIVQNKTGFLVENNPAALAKKTLEVLRDRQLLLELQEQSFKQAKTFTWDKTAEASIKFLNKYGK